MIELMRTVLFNFTSLSPMGQFNVYMGVFLGALILAWAIFD